MLHFMRLLYIKLTRNIIHDDEGTEQVAWEVFENNTFSLSRSYFVVVFFCLEYYKDKNKLRTSDNNFVLCGQCEHKKAKVVS